VHQSFSHQHNFCQPQAQASREYKSNEWPQQGSKSCYRCEEMPSHGRIECPATDAGCHNCGKTGHYGKVCRTSVKSLNAVSTEEEESLCLDAGKNPWTVQLQLRDKKVCFKIDTGTGLLWRPYSIKLKPDAVPFSLHAPRRVREGGDRPYVTIFHKDE